MYIPKDMFGRPVTLENARSQVGDGWSDLIDELYSICVENELNIFQIKEKYGTLRFYIGTATEEIFDKIDDICARSANICEDCGGKGETMQVHGWYRTVCEKCYEKATKDR